MNFIFKVSFVLDFGIEFGTREGWDFFDLVLSWFFCKFFFDAVFRGYERVFLVIIFSLMFRI